VPDTVAASRRALLTEAASILAGAGISQPRREALRLWAELPGRGTGDWVTADEPVRDGEVRAYQAMVRRRATGEPFAHVAGRAGFRTLVLRSDRRALIPRPETEGLVDLLLARVRTGRVADVGTGTGCLALSLAAEGSFEQVLGIDVSPEALASAAENRELTGLAVDLVRGDLCGPLAGAGLDALVSNPPYLTAAELEVLDPSVRDWEPAAALESGPDGMAATRRLLDDGRRVLRPGGWIALEVDCTRARRCAALARGLGWNEILVENDLFGRERYLLARRSATS
jgi:release factor glutamine methyltransferase